MKKTIFAICLLFILALPAALSGCGSARATEGTNPAAVSILIGNHLSGKRPNIASAPIREAVSKAVSSYGYISVICVDGEPNIVLEGSCDIDDRYKGADPQKLAQDSANRALSLLNGLQSVMADSPEVDTLEAIRLAARSYASAPEGAEKVIVIADTGLSTTGSCDFRNNLLSGDPEAVAEALEEREAIPDLTGIHVIWQHLGDVDLPQESLTPRQLNRLKSIWAAIIERGGGTLTICDVPPLSTNRGAEMPEVSTVSLSAELPVVFRPEIIQEDTFAFDEPVFLSEGQVRFKADSDVFADTEKAVEVIRPIAELMKRSAGLRLLLVGTTAGDSTGAYSLALSENRAGAVKKALVSLGVEEGRVITKGLGSEDPWHISNVGTQGTLAAQNRKVVLLNADSEIAREVMAINVDA